MEYRKVFWGIILVLLGVLLVLKNLGVLMFSWHSVWHLWPLLLILWGISVLPVKDLWKIVVSLGVIGLAVVLMLTKPVDPDDHWGWDWDSDEPQSDAPSYQHFDEPWDSTTRVAVLSLEAAAGEFMLSNATPKLIDVEKKGIIGSYSMEVEDVGDSSVVTLEMHGSDIKGNNHGGNKVDLSLNATPVWHIDMEAGAADVEMDLSPFKIASFSLDGGASSVSLKLGSLYPTTSLDLEAGASSVTVDVPQAAGCEVQTNTVMSNRELDGFDKIEKGLYRTPGFDAAAQKVYITLDAAVSSITVNRY